MVLGCCCYLFLNLGGNNMEVCFIIIKLHVYMFYLCIQKILRGQSFLF